VLACETDLALVKAVIFDVDGTLYQQGPLRRAMLVRLVRTHLFHPVRGWQTARVIGAYRRAQEQLRSVPGRADLADAQLQLAAERSGVGYDEVTRCVEQWMVTAPLELLARFGQPGLEESLRALRTWGLKLAVLSDYPPGPKLEALGVAGLFDVVLWAQQPEIGVFKPHPRGLEVALERLGVTADEALYVGDRADVDAVAAAAARIPCAILAEARHGAHDIGYLQVTSFQEMRNRLEPQ
jgi:FMN phosphatase YigB (HAD superfamily)